jgi:hypothetical protein
MKTYSKTFKSTLAIATCAIVGISAYAAVDVDPETGEGFVGKGDVQLALGWNNNTLQNNFEKLVFRAITTSDTTWTCTNSNNGNIQERNRTITSGTLLSHEERAKNQVSGFFLDGYEGEPSVIDSEGPPLNSCPTNWTYAPGSTVGGSTAEIEVSFDGGEWILLGDS